MNKLSVTEQYRARTELLGDKLSGVSYGEIEQYVIDYMIECILEHSIPIKVIDAVVYGSRSRGKGRADSDIDVVVEYEPVGKKYIKEYVIYNILREEVLMFENYVVDINPITSEETGSLNEYLLRAERYKEKIKMCEF